MNQHKPMCKINQQCAFSHSDTICPGPYGKCDCGLMPNSLANQEPKDRSCCDRCSGRVEDENGFASHYGCQLDTCECHTKAAAEWEEDLLRITSKRFTLDDIASLIHFLLKETQDKTRREILAALPRLPQPEIKPHELKTYEDGLRAGAYAIVSDIRNTITNQNKG